MRWKLAELAVWLFLYAALAAIYQFLFGAPQWAATIGALVTCLILRGGR